MNLILFPRALPRPPNHIFTASFRTFDGRGDEKRGIFPSNHSLSPSTYYQPTTIVMFTIGCSLLLFSPISLPPTFVCPESNSPAHSLASLRNPECFSSCNNFYQGQLPIYEIITGHLNQFTIDRNIKTQCASQSAITFTFKINFPWKMNSCTLKCKS